MQVVIRNFIKLLSTGAFQSYCTLEEMSEYKWNQLLYIAKINDVEDFIISGIIYSDNSSNNIIPTKITNSINETIYSNTTRITPKDAQYRQSTKTINKFSNPYLNKKLNRIIYNEIHSIDTSVDSITFLNRSIDNIKNLLSANSYIRDLVEYGIYLRKYGNKIDFVKIDNWINTLKMNKIMNLIGIYLIKFFNFDTSEIPFYNNQNKIKTGEVKLPLNLKAKSEDKMNETQKEINNLICNIPKPNTGMFKYFSFFPLETTSIFFSNIFNSLSNIEE